MGLAHYGHKITRMKRGSSPSSFSLSLSPLPLPRAYLLDVLCPLGVFFISLPLHPFFDFMIFLEADLSSFSIRSAYCWVRFGSNLCRPCPSLGPPRRMLHHLATRIHQCPSHLLHWIHLSRCGLILVLSRCFFLFRF